jgi:urease accessory protein
MTASILELLLADGRTPSGGYAHSCGVEAAVAAGMDTEAIPAFMSARARTTVLCEAAIAAAATGAESLRVLLSLDHEFAARTLAPPLRAASRSLGLGLLRTAEQLWASDRLLRQYRQRSEYTPRPVCVGVTARAAGLDSLQAARLVLYEDAAAIASAAVKLCALDAARATAWVAQLAPELARLAATVEGARTATLPSTSTPLLDLRALAHQQDDRRLFAS